MKEKKGQSSMFDYIVYVAIAVGVLVLMLLIYALLTGKITGVLDYFRNLVRFGQ